MQKDEQVLYVVPNAPSTRRHYPTQPQLTKHVDTMIHLNLWYNKSERKVSKPIITCL